MQPLKKSGLLEKVLNNMTEYVIKAGCADIFNSYVMDFLNNSELYQRIETDTAPFYIIMDRLLLHQMAHMEKIQNFRRLKNRH